MEIKEECKKKIAKQKLEKHEEIPSHENFEKDTKVLKAKDHGVGYRGVASKRK